MDPEINAISSEDPIGEYPAVRYAPPTGNLYLDVLTRLGETASFETVEAEIKNIDGTSVRVATPAALYRLKNGTIRWQDQADAERWAKGSILKMRNRMPVHKCRSIEEMNKASEPSAAFR